MIAFEGTSQKRIYNLISNELDEQFTNYTIDALALVLFKEEFIL